MKFTTSIYHYSIYEQLLKNVSSREGMCWNRELNRLSVTAKRRNGEHEHMLTQTSEFFKSYAQILLISFWRTSGISVMVEITVLTIILMRVCVFLSPVIISSSMRIHLLRDGTVDLWARMSPGIRSAMSHCIDILRNNYLFLVAPLF